MEGLLSPLQIFEMLCSGAGYARGAAGDAEAVEQKRSTSATRGVDILVVGHR